MGESRKWMLIATAIGIIFFSLWTLLLIGVALMAESGGKNPQPLVALATLWPLAELVWTWIWIVRHGEQYSNSKRRSLGDALLIAALLSPVLVMTVGIMLTRLDVNDHRFEWVIILPLGFPIVCCHIARVLWSRAGEQRQARMAESK